MKTIDQIRFPMKYILKTKKISEVFLPQIQKFTMVKKRKAC